MSSTVHLTSTAFSDDSSKIPAPKAIRNSEVRYWLQGHTINWIGATGKQVARAATAPELEMLEVLARLSPVMEQKPADA